MPEPKRVVMMFSAAGACMLHSDAAAQAMRLPVGRIERLTCIEYNNSSREWEVRLPSGGTVHAGPTREGCLAWESEHAAELLRGHQPAKV